MQPVSERLDTTGKLCGVCDDGTLRVATGLGFAGGVIIEVRRRCIFCTGFPAFVDLQRVPSLGCRKGRVPGRGGPRAFRVSRLVSRLRSRCTRNR